MPDDRVSPDEDDSPVNPHEVGFKTFARVFANDLAKNEIDKEKPNFAVGSIIVREKLVKSDDVTPQVVTVMVKREKNFSRKTNDWEFFVLEGALAKVNQRETTGSCAKCHAQAKETDFVFRTYLKKSEIPVVEKIIQ